jgi:hypothetical protein
MLSAVAVVVITAPVVVMLVTSSMVVLLAYMYAVYSSISADIL